MEILGSTQYVDLTTQKEPWLQLSVINQWDWKTKAVVMRILGNNTRISYSLNLNTPKTEDRYSSEVIEELTVEMEQVLLDKGYTLLN